MSDLNRFYVYSSAYTEANGFFKIVTSSEHFQKIDSLQRCHFYLMLNALGEFLEYCLGFFCLLKDSSRLFLVFFERHGCWKNS